MTKSTTLLREAFAGLGVTSEHLPTWLINLEKAERRPANQPARPRDLEFRITKYDTPSPKPFAIWWAEWFDLDKIPEWMRAFPDWCALYTNRSFDEVEELAPAPPAETTADTTSLPPLPWAFSPKVSRQEAKAAARRTAESWPARRKVRLVFSTVGRRKKIAYRKAGDLTNRPGAMVVLEIKCRREFNPDRHKKVADLPLAICPKCGHEGEQYPCPQCGEAKTQGGKTKTVRTLAGEVKVVQPEIRPTRYKILVGKRAKVEMVLHKDRIGGQTVVIGSEFARGHDAHLARQEQAEKMFGFEVTSGCQKPRWMTTEQWEERQSSQLFSYLNTNWTSYFAAGNPDLQAKFSGLEL